MDPEGPEQYVVGTPAAFQALEDAGERPVTLLARHVAGDWGELDEHDRAENEFPVARGFRVLSAYKLSTGTRIWIITEADRSVTTLLLPTARYLERNLEEEFPVPVQGQW